MNNHNMLLLLLTVFGGRENQNNKFSGNPENLLITANSVSYIYLTTKLIKSNLEKHI
jgi:hypothetical protein